MIEVPGWVAKVAGSARKVSVLTGAGMSAESGVPTFRDAQEGTSLWEDYDPQLLVSVDSWYADPELVWAWHLWLAGLVHRSEPNPGHVALAQWAARDGVDVRVITQNIDDLHERAGSPVLAHLHGNLFAFRCADCERPYDDSVEFLSEPEERRTPPDCGHCGGFVRPEVVWFGEVLPHRDVEDSIDAMLDSDLVLVVGTSGIVQPAASLPDIARGHGTPVVEINPAPTRLSGRVDYCWREPAGVALPALVRALPA